MGQELDGLRQAIVDKYGTVHHFCRRSPQLNRSTVYMVLNGNYPGNMAGQIKRIKQALADQDKSGDVFQAIKTEACRRCAVTVPCNKCDKMFKAQASAVLQIFSS
ncbi:hypothetical protein [Desulfovibrio sp. UCD-KL4C]|uniref:hypothetical protein n=1 Tax=Desulfovibrio sp. UCD-KL4C TaxID=2578120 RepID=UPI0025C1817E|nr:hypothetical protein [Desulfovibrio sp. UCD-KL4C]